MAMNFKKIAKGSTALCWPIALFGLVAPSAFAQDDRSVGGLAEIVVTAQKRSESVQDTPLAISALNAEMLESRGVADVVSLSALAPSLTTTAGTGKSNAIIKIRAIGESDVQLTNDSPVGIYVDGVIVGRAAGGSFELLDLERVEVLRGPQGTLYGRNTTGGAVNLIMRKPGDEFGAEFTGSFGRWDYLQARASVDTGEIGDTGLAARFSVLHRQRDGSYDNLTTPDRHDPGSFNADSVRAAVSFDKGTGIRGYYSYDYTHMRSTAVHTQLTAAAQRVIDYFGSSESLGGAPFQGPRPTQRNTFSAGSNITTDKTQGHNLTVELDLSSNLTLRSITGHRRMVSDLVDGDIDGLTGLVGLVVSPGTPSVRSVRLFDGDIYRKQRQFSQEFNLIGSAGDWLDYVVGAFYFEESGREVNPQKLTAVIPIGGGQFGGVDVVNNLVYSMESKSKALFGQVTAELVPGLKFTGGLRHTRDDKKVDQVSPMPRALENDWSKLNWSATVQYEFNPDIMAFGRVATGYKAGGFNVRANNDGYDPEYVTSYEVGLKSDLLDRRLRFNGTLFYMSLRDKQLNQLFAGGTGLVTETVNAGKAIYKGVELEVEALPVDSLRLNASLGYTDPSFKTFMFFDTDKGQFVNIGNDAKFTYSSKVTMNAGAEYEFGDVLGGILSARLDYSYRSGARYNIIPYASISPFDEAIRAKGYGLLDGRIMLSDLKIGNSEAVITLWGRNLTNKKYRTQGIDFGSLGFGVNSYGEPTSYGLDVKFKL